MWCGDFGVRSLAPCTHRISLSPPYMDHKSAGSTVTIQISIHVLASCPIIWLVYNQFVGFFPNYQCVSGYSQQHCCILTPGKVPRCQNTVQYHTKKDFPIKCVDVGIRFSFFIQPSGWTKNWQSIIFVFGCGKDSPHPHMQCFDWINDFFPLWFCIPTGWTKKKDQCCIKPAIHGLEFSHWLNKNIFLSLLSLPRIGLLLIYFMPEFYYLPTL